jgi:hypothetical protein
VRIHNVHERSLPVLPDRVGGLLDGLSTDPDPLWPTGHWPPMRFDRTLGPGAAGGHGPIRYRVKEHDPGRRVRFRFTGPPGLSGRNARDSVPQWTPPHRPPASPFAAST